MVFSDLICYEHSDEDPLVNLIELLDDPEMLSQVEKQDDLERDILSMQETDESEDCIEVHARA